MPHPHDEWLNSSELATCLGVSRLTVIAMEQDGRLPPSTRFTPMGHRYWRTEQIEQWLAANPIEFPKRPREPNRRPAPESLERQYAIRRRFVERDGQVRTAELAEQFGVSRAQVAGVLRGVKLGGSRYDRLQDDGLQPAIDRLWPPARKAITPRSPEERRAQKP